MLVHGVLLLVMNYGGTEIFGCFVFSGLMPGAGWECQSGCRGMRDKLVLEGILELAGVECGSCDNSVDFELFFGLLLSYLWVVFPLIFFYCKNPSDDEHGCFWSGGRCWYIQGW